MSKIERNSRAPRLNGLFSILLLSGLTFLASLASGQPASEDLSSVGPETAEVIADGDIIFEKNLRIPLRDGRYVAANVFRPAAPGEYPAILSMSAYGKDVATRDFNPPQWNAMLAGVPDLCATSSCEHHVWETPDPEVWVPFGYAVVRIDAPGSGKSPGFLNILSFGEAEAYYDAIEWAAVQPWSNGKTGLLGISYYAITQWMVASLQPPSLAAMIPWEGFTDAYRDAYRHGGILSNFFWEFLYPLGMVGMQHGNCAGPRKNMDGSHVGGPDCLSVEELKANHVDVVRETEERHLDGEWYRSRSADLSRVTVPFLSGANWGGLGLHLRGNVEGFMQAASEQKWLEIHGGGDHILPFYRRSGIELQRQFFDHFLKGEDNGWDQRPPVTLMVRHADDTYVDRGVDTFPLPETRWEKWYLDASTDGVPQEGGLAPEVPSGNRHFTFYALGDGPVFLTAPFSRETEITGPVVAQLAVSTTSSDMDIFATLQLFDREGREVTYQGANDAAAPISQGWLRLSQRKLDENKSEPWRPYHSHDSVEEVRPNEIYPVQVEIWPTSIVVPIGYRLALRIEGKDFNRNPDGNLSGGSSLFLHNSRYDRPAAIFGGENSIHTGGTADSFLLLPVIPAE